MERADANIRAYRSALAKQEREKEIRSGPQAEVLATANTRILDLEEGITVAIEFFEETDNKEAFATTLYGLIGRDGPSGEKLKELLRG